MPRLALIEPKDAAGDAARILATAPINIYKGMAANPEVFTTFIAFMRSIATSGAISKAEKELVMLYAAEQRHCGYCVAAHTRVAAGAGVNGERALDARRGRAGNAREQALLDFTKAVMDKNGGVSDAELAAFRAAGFDDRAAIEVVAAITAMTFTALYNHINDTAVDFPPVPALVTTA
ncbi:MAG: carboxymuconolactone decarboxylase family protein [Phycisphaerales bacterium]